MIEREDDAVSFCNARNCIGIFLKKILRVFGGILNLEWKEVLGKKEGVYGLKIWELLFCKGNWWGDWKKLVKFLGLTGQLFFNGRNAEEHTI